LQLFKLGSFEMLDAFICCVDGSNLAKTDRNLMSSIFAVKAA
jgi:hypothetical protein